MADSTNVSHCDDYHWALFGGNLAASTVAPEAPEVEAEEPAEEPKKVAAKKAAPKRTAHKAEAEK